MLDTDNKTLSVSESEDSLSNKVEYSTNGIDWTTYQSNVNYGVSNRYVYVRVIETVADKASAVWVIEIPTSEETG